MDDSAELAWPGHDCDEEVLIYISTEVSGAVARSVQARGTLTILGLDLAIFLKLDLDNS